MTEQRGAATVLTVAMAGVLLLVGAAAGVVGAIMAAHRTAQSAADLAALAGAATLADHSGRDPCAAAGEVASANGAHLDTCAVEDADVVVRVTVRGPRWLGQDRDLTARARAGPEPSGVRGVRGVSPGSPRRGRRGRRDAAPPRRGRASATAR